MIKIDGAYGEGGGQILRTALTLSMIRQEPIRIESIRANRKKPGLRPQHLACALAAAAISGARLEGAEIGSKALSFIPSRVRPGTYRFDIGTAGSVMLLFQTLLFPLCLAKAPSRLILTGGTHVPWSPCFHYIDRVFRPATGLMGINFELELKRWGWYPKGGGIVDARIFPSRIREGFCPVASDRGSIEALSASSMLPTHIRFRQAKVLKDILQSSGMEIHLETRKAPASSPGSLAFCWLKGSGRFAGYASLGARGKPAEKVAREAASKLMGFLASKTLCDEHLSDQMLLPAFMAPGKSHWSTHEATRHMHTNAWVCSKFHPGKKVSIKRQKGLFSIEVVDASKPQDSPSRTIPGA